jgi:hypothetical protein
MNSRMRRHLLSMIMAACGSFAFASSAGADTASFVDLELGAGISSNPLLQLDGRSSGFGRISAFGLHEWRSELGSTKLTGYVESDTYLKHYGSKQIFDLKAHTDRAVSPTVKVYGDLDFSGDFSGQLSNRVISVPDQPVVPDPSNPLPPTSSNPNLVGLAGRQYRLLGQVGTAIQSSSKSTVSLGAGAERLFFTGANKPANYSLFFGNVGYSHELNERTSLGGSVFVQRQDFKGSDYANIINPAVKLRTQLRENLSVDLAAGLLAIDQRVAGEKEHSVSPSFSAALCSEGTVSRLCGRFSRDAQSALGTALANRGGRASVTTSGSLDYYRRIKTGEAIQASFSGVRYSAPDNLAGEKTGSTYLSAVVRYDRKVGNRLSLGAAVGARKLYQGGPDPDLDFNGTLSLRYRIGDVQ